MVWICLGRSGRRRRVKIAQSVRVLVWCVYVCVCVYVYARSHEHGRRLPCASGSAREPSDGSERETSKSRPGYRGGAASASRAVCAGELKISAFKQVARGVPSDLPCGSFCAGVRRRPDATRHARRRLTPRDTRDATPDTRHATPPRAVLKSTNKMVVPQIGDFSLDPTCTHTSREIGSIVSAKRQARRTICATLGLVLSPQCGSPDYQALDRIDKMSCQRARESET